MSPTAEGFGPYSDDSAALTPLEYRLLRIAAARRALRAAQAVESRWIREALGRSGPGERKINLAQDARRRDARRPPDTGSA